MAANPKHFKMAKQAVYKSGNYAYIGRKQKNVTSEDCGSPEFLLAAAQTTSPTLYSSMVLKKAGIDLNRKMLSEIAIHDEAAFTALVEKAKAAL